jgi:hypothetical protein
VFQVKLAARAGVTLAPIATNITKALARLTIAAIMVAPPLPRIPPSVADLRSCLHQPELDLGLTVNIVSRSADNKNPSVGFRSQGPVQLINQLNPRPQNRLGLDAASTLLARADEVIE